jgi:sodium/proline symporter
MNWMYFSLALYFLGMLAIGYYASNKMNNLSDYMLGGRLLGPAVAALSAGASDMSGWLLMGLPGAMFARGLSEGWIVVGLLIGSYLNWLYVAPRLRIFTEVAGNSLTIPDFLENRFVDKSRLLRVISAVVIFVFFCIYTSSGMVSGGRLFETLFPNLENTYTWGVIITSLVVLAYTLFGGFLAVSLTDFVQGLIMVVALTLVPAMVFYANGGVVSTFDIIEKIDPKLLDFFPENMGFVGFISLMAWGLGYFGQPHIIVRFMAIGTLAEIKKARRIGITWMFFSIVGAMLIGLVGVAFFENSHYARPENPETVFILLSQILFHPILVGFLMAAILSAVMSTISSQLLVTSSALAGDFYKAFLKPNASDKELIFVSRLAVFGVAMFALSLALNPSDTILGIVAYAWAGLGAAFGPVILFSLYWKRMNKWAAIAGISTGAIVVLSWKIFHVYDDLYEIIPGFFANTLVIILVSLLGEKPKAQSIAEFEETDRKMKL